MRGGTSVCALKAQRSLLRFDQRFCLTTPLPIFLLVFLAAEIEEAHPSPSVPRLPASSSFAYMTPSCSTSDFSDSPFFSPSSSATLGASWHDALHRVVDALTGTAEAVCALSSAAIDAAVAINAPVQAPCPLPRRTSERDVCRCSRVGSQSCLSDSARLRRASVSYAALPTLMAKASRVPPSKAPSTRAFASKALPPCEERPRWLAERYAEGRQLGFKLQCVTRCTSRSSGACVLLAALVRLR